MATHRPIVAMGSKNRPDQAGEGGPLRLASATVRKKISQRRQSSMGDGTIGNHISDVMAEHFVPTA